MSRHRRTGDLLAIAPRAALLLLASMVCAACGGGPGVAAPVPNATEFRIQPGDQLRITVWPDNEMGLSGEYTVEENGLVYLPLVGGVEVVGLTLAETRSLLRQSFGQVIKEAVVTVTPLFPVVVLGAVVRPGLYRVTPSQSLFEVISLAGGFTQSAEEDEVEIIREGRVIELDARMDEYSGIDLSLRSGDRIVVPVDRWRFSFRDAVFLLQSAVVIITLLDRLENR